MWIIIAGVVAGRVASLAIGHLPAVEEGGTTVRHLATCDFAASILQITFSVFISGGDEEHQDGHDENSERGHCEANDTC